MKRTRIVPCSDSESITISSFCVAWLVAYKKARETKAQTIFCSSLLIDAESLFLKKVLGIKIGGAVPIEIKNFTFTTFFAIKSGK